MRLYGKLNITSTNTINIGSMNKIFEDASLYYNFNAISGSGIVKLSAYWNSSSSIELLFEQEINLTGENLINCNVLPPCSSFPKNYITGTPGNWYFEITTISYEDNFKLSLCIIQLSAVVDTYFSQYSLLLMCNLSFIRLYIPANLTLEQKQKSTLTFEVKPSLPAMVINKINAISGCNTIERSLSIYENGKPNLLEGGYAASLQFTDEEIEQNFTEIVLIGSSTYDGTFTFEVVEVLLNTPTNNGLTKGQLSAIIISSIIGFSIFVVLIAIIIYKLYNRHRAIKDTERQPLSTEIFQI